MATLGNFNAEEFTDSFEPIPAGRYTAMIVKSDTVENKAKNGSYIKLEVDIVDGQYKGRKLFQNLNLNNPSEMAVKIAKTELANICRAVGILHPKDSSELHNRPIQIKVTIRPETEAFPASNEIKGWYSLSEPKAVMPGTPVSSGKPWERPAPAPDPTF